MFATNFQISKLNRWLRFTTLAVLVLIFIGGFVRASGSGLGCPDWPTCYGQWIPPISIQQVAPADRATFNVVLTWTEYLNRLAGMTIGVFFLILVYRAFRVRREYPLMLWMALASLALVGFQGWLGSVVVSTVLAPVVVTTHMVVAVLILALLVLQRTFLLQKYRLDNIHRNAFPFEKLWVIGLGVGILVLILIGTQVREMVDVLTDNLSIPLTPNWAQVIGWPLDLHKWLAIAVFIATIVFLRKYLEANPTNDRVHRNARWLMSLWVMQLVMGFIFLLLHIPMLLQPLHLTVGCGILVVYLDLTLPGLF